jgi:hypothetical protein
MDRARRHLEPLPGGNVKQVLPEANLHGPGLADERLEQDGMEVRAVAIDPRSATGLGDDP